jgi:hypothetical protein
MYGTYDAYVNKVRVYMKSVGPAATFTMPQICHMWHSPMQAANDGDTGLVSRYQDCTSCDTLARSH